MPPTPGSSRSQLTPSTTGQIIEEIEVMLHHALGRGLMVGNDAPATFEAACRDLEGNPDASVVANRLNQLMRLHDNLSRAVAPALPGSLVYLQKEKSRKGRLHILGSVGLVRRLMCVALLSIVGLFALSLSPEVNGSPSNFSLLQNSGSSLFLNELFLLAAASLGVSFANLYQAQIYLRNLTFDPSMEPSYWVRYVLGIMSGTILAFLVPVEHFLEGSTEATMHGMAKPTLALLGGFSTQALYRILFQMVSAIESIVRGNGQDALEVERARIQLEGERQEQQQRQILAAQIRTLQGRTSNPEARASLDTLLDDLMQSGELVGSAPIARATAPAEATKDTGSPPPDDAAETPASSKSDADSAVKND